MANAAALRELWRRGEIEPLLYHSGQKKINELYNSISTAVVTLNISRQWGKTFFAVVKAISTAIKNPGCRVRVGAAFETDLAEFIEPAFDTALTSCPRDLRPRFKQQGKKYFFPNGSTIKLVGLDRKPNGLRGNAIDLIIIDEAGFVSRLDYLHTSVIVPLTTHRPNAKILIQSTPPESPDHEFWDFVDRAKLEGSYAEFNIDQNPLLTTQDISRIEREMGGRETTAFKREYLCQRIVEAERAIVPEWKDEYEVDLDPQSDIQYQFWHKYEFMDIGVQVDKTVCLFGYFNFREQRLYIMHELDFSGSKTTTDLIYSKLQEKEKEIGYESPYRRISDNSHPLLLNDLAAKGTVFAATDKGKLFEMVGELRVWVRTGRVRVHKRCKQTIGCLRSGIWDDKRTEFARSKVYGHNDALAALIYGVRNTDAWTNPIPDWFVNPDRMPGIKPQTRLSPFGQDMKALFSILK